MQIPQPRSCHVRDSCGAINIDYQHRVFVVGFFCVTWITTRRLRFVLFTTINIQKSHDTLRRWAFRKPCHELCRVRSKSAACREKTFEMDARPLLRCPNEAPCRAKPHRRSTPQARFGIEKCCLVTPTALPHFLRACSVCSLEFFVSLRCDNSGSCAKRSCLAELAGNSPQSCSGYFRVN